MQAVLIGIVGVLLAFAGGTFYGMGLGEDREFAKRAREDAIITQVREAAQEAAAQEIAKIKPRNVTIRQEMQREVQIEKVYTECKLTPNGFKRLNEALVGSPGQKDHLDEFVRKQ